MPQKGYVYTVVQCESLNLIWYHKQVFTRLNKLGVVVSHRSAVRLTRAMGGKHALPVQDWKAALELEPSSEKGFVIVGDNIDD